MGRRPASPKSVAKRKSRPATTPEARENQLIALAYDLVEQRLLDGTATSQETTSLIKLGTVKARLEAEKLRRENEFLSVKSEAIASTQRMEELYKEAIRVMKTYNGQVEDADYEDVY